LLAWRDVKVRYSQTLLGALWAVLQPVAAAAVFVLVFARLMPRSSQELPYSAFVLSGLVPWVFFSNALLAGANSIITSANLVTKVYFPRILIPAASALAGLLDLLLSGAVLAGFLWLRGVPVSIDAAAMVASLLALVAVALGSAFWAAALNVRYRDFRHALPFLVQLGLFVTPVIYSVAGLPASSRKIILMLNPMAGVVETFRSSIFGTALTADLGVAWFALSFLLLASGAAVFRAVERELADVI
jgi:lipopolysaccharide transport system permease protein